MPALIVLSARRWDCEYERPQELLSRLAHWHSVVYVEVPAKAVAAGQADRVTAPARPQAAAQVGNDASAWQWSRPRAGLSVLHLRAASRRLDRRQLQPLLENLLYQLSEEHGDAIAWIDDANLLPLLKCLRPAMVVADCLQDAPDLHNAMALLDAADLAFTRSPRLCQAGQAKHARIHCLPGSVDAPRFLPALDRANSHPLHRDIGGPRLGYYGPLNKRLDMQLLTRLADAHTQWQLVLVGALEGLREQDLPQRPNIHYLGPQPYAALPAFLAGWDVCLLPYLQGDCPLNPAVTLEYMAAELPIVSTLADVAGRVGEVLSIAGSAEDFIAACEAALLATPAERQKRIRRMRALLTRACWDDCASDVAELLAKACAGQQHAVLRAAPAGEDEDEHASQAGGLATVMSPLLELVAMSEQQPGGGMLAK